MPGDHKHHTDKFRRCVEQVVAKGHEEDSAYAICTTSLQNAGEAIFEAMAAGSDEEIRTLAEWDESQHLRDEGGKFSGGGGDPRKSLRDQNPAAVRQFLAIRKETSGDVKEEFKAWMRGEHGSHDFVEEDFELDDYAQTMGRSVPSSPSRVPEGIAVRKEGINKRRSVRYAEEHGEPRTLHLLGATGVVRREELNGRKHLVVPVVALMEGVIHAVNASTPEFVSGEVLRKAAASWVGKPVTLGHPARAGKQCSASDATVRKESGIGVIMKSIFLENGKKLTQEAWIDEEKAKLLAPVMYESLAAGKTEEVSVGAMVVANTVGGNYNGKQYKGAWLETSGDHLAFLPGARGACSCEMGCGTHRFAMHLVTAQGIEPLATETFLALEGKSLDERIQLVQRAVDKWNSQSVPAPAQPSMYAYARQVFDDRVIIEMGGKTFSVPYTVSGEEVTFGSEPVEVKQQWVALSNYKDCPMCHGSGNLDGNPCEACDGEGIMRNLGGKGSGNFGHSGRPGQVGGSSSEGGDSAKAQRTQAHLDQQDRIRFEGGRYLVLASDGRTKLGAHLSRSSAEEHLEKIDRILASS